MYLLILGIPLAWTLVLTIHLLKNFRILLSLLRWTLWTYLFCFALLMSEVVREGLMTNGDAAFVQDMGFWWFMWTLLIIAGALVPWALAPATLLPVVLFSHPPFRMLINFGLARLGWTALVYSPVFWLATNLGPLLWELFKAGYGVLRGGSWVMEGLDRFHSPGKPVPFGDYEWTHSG
ncbi:hypothetical protein JX265_011897 [Neoarthrinium moseri]|uniref:Uncharacterized protein n=1 Tax=Neoarthrinium moseri TaxID=1658444 RepID=A0A9P9WBI0_9PEZI|nr:uncharacterized protein JN550_013568 [Neoarthrinium moseri]KAI1846424.1 hypothetical protein JX266_007629 [Neoarthrinium moseri]KAI1856000.1 hypothetical protein JX265_011897 [Neoarthrinium moseri]KAI1856932.1 hypothetical protein JN550_013568 [Neoarthrinium moseri]